MYVDHTRNAKAESGSLGLVLAGAARLLPYALPAVMLAIAGLLLFGSSGRDDAHITYWPAYTLMHAGRMLNYNGEYVEQSSSLLQVFILAVIGKLSGVNLVSLGRLGSLFSGMLTAVVIYDIVAPREGRATGFLSAVLIALSPYFIYWSLGGLETTLAALLSTVFLISLSGFFGGGGRPASLWWAAASMLLLEITRPEMILVAGCILLGSAIALLVKSPSGDPGDRGKILRRSLAIFLAYAIVSGSIFLFRHVYFGSWWPQPVIAKSAPITRELILQGLEYARASLWPADWPTRALAVALGLSVIFVGYEEARKERPDIYYLLAIVNVLVYLAFVVLVGGDWMEGGRFLVPLLPGAVAFVPIAVGRLIRGRKAWMLASLLLVVVEVASLISFARDSSTGIPSWSQASFERQFDLKDYSWFERRNRVNIRDSVSLRRLDGLVHLLLKHKGPPVVILTIQMGIVPYHLRAEYGNGVRFIDRAGLTDREFTGCALTRTQTRTQFGLPISYRFYLDEFPALEHACEFTKPDLIYDLHPLNEADVTGRGYTIIFKQAGYVPGDPLWLPGATLAADEFIAVRDDLLTSLGSPNAEVVRFGPLK